jgi:hypothetical protein
VSTFKVQISVSVSILQIFLKMMRLFCFLLGLSFGSICLVSSCDAAEDEAVLAFACSSVQQCRESWEVVLSKTSAIDVVAVESERVQQVADAVRRTCGNCLSAVISRNDVARVPFSFAVSYASFVRDGARRAELEMRCGKTWALEHCTESGCLDRNITCEKELEATTTAQRLSQLRCFYALRRQRKILEKLKAACETNDFCMSFLRVLGKELDSSILSFTPTRVEDYNDLLARILRRPCGTFLKCASELLDPIFFADDVNQTRRALRNAVDSLRTPVENATLWDFILNISNVPFVPCSFVQKASKSGLLVCSQELAQRAPLETFLAETSYFTFASSSQYVVIVDQLRRCLWNCNLKRDLAVSLHLAPIFRERSARVFVEYARVLCPSSLCVTESTNFFRSEFPEGPVLSFEYEKGNPSLYISIFALTLESCTILVCFALLWIIFWNWKQGFSEWVVLVLLVIVMSAANLIWFVLSLQFLFFGRFIQDLADLLFLAGQSLGILSIASFLTLNWAFAMLEIFDVPVKLKVERICKVCVVLLIISLGVVLIVSGAIFIAGKVVSLANGETETIFANCTFSIEIVSLLFCVAFASFSWAGWVFVRRKNEPRAKQIGLLKMLVLSTVVCATQAVKFASYALQSQHLGPTVWLVPEWFRLLLVRCLIQAIQSTCFLILAFGGARSKRSSVAIELTTFKTPLLEEGKVPKIYAY